jgi:hypothetical protein
LPVDTEGAAAVPGYLGKVAADQHPLKAAIRTGG